MRGMNVEMALRYFLDQFTLPGQSEAVDRIVQKFSDKYFHDNANSFFKSSDCVYTFSYLLILL
jgi:Sec7-like guanine-nucleotide exchange factor